MPVPLILTLLLQGSPRATAELRAGLDVLYGGEFEVAASHFAALAATDTAAPAPLVFQASAYIWWAAALDSSRFERARIDSLLELAIDRARALGPRADFWLATAHGYRARERQMHGHNFGAARDAKTMRDAYQRVLVTDTSCVDCYLGLGVYHYGLGRAGGFARFVARLIGLGTGNAEEGIRHLRRVAHDGDLAQVEATWVLAAALVREAERDPDGRAVLHREARTYVEGLAARFPENPVFRRFLTEIP